MLNHDIKGFPCLHVWSESRHLILACITLYAWLQGSLKGHILMQNSSYFNSVIWLDGFISAHSWYTLTDADCTPSSCINPAMPAALTGLIISQIRSFWQQHYSLMTQYFLWISHFTEVWRNFCKLIIDVRTDYTSSFIRRETNNPEVILLFTLTGR